jgi:hypothetical protein
VGESVAEELNEKLRRSSISDAIVESQYTERSLFVGLRSAKARPFAGAKGDTVLTTALVD